MYSLKYRKNYFFGSSFCPAFICQIISSYFFPLNDHFILFSTYAATKTSRGGGNLDMYLVLQQMLHEIVKDFFLLTKPHKEDTLKPNRISSFRVCNAVTYHLLGLMFFKLLLLYLCRCSDWCII